MDSWTFSHFSKYLEFTYHIKYMFQTHLKKIMHWKHVHMQNLYTLHTIYMYVRLLAWGFSIVRGGGDSTSFNERAGTHWLNNKLACTLSLSLPLCGVMPCVGYVKIFFFYIMYPYAEISCTPCIWSFMMTPRASMDWKTKAHHTISRILFFTRVRQFTYALFLTSSWGRKLLGKVDLQNRRTVTLLLSNN